MKKFEYKGKQWHDECFICAECNQPIGNKSFIPRDDRVICVPCYESNYAQKCSKCSGVRTVCCLTQLGNAVSGPVPPLGIVTRRSAVS